MPALKRYGIFISHAWGYHEDYDRLVEKLESAPNFSWNNFSRPYDRPVAEPGSRIPKSKLLESLERQIAPVNCVVVLAGMYVAHSEWIQDEIDIALDKGKPVVGVRPWGHERIPRAVSDVASEVVGWNAPSIVEAIRRWSI